MKKLTFLFACLGILTTMHACQNFDDTVPDQLQLNSDLARIQSLGYEIDDIFIGDDFYIVEGDIMITSDHLREFESVKTRQTYYGPNYLVSVPEGEKRTLNIYCTNSVKKAFNMDYMLMYCMTQLDLSGFSLMLDYDSSKQPDIIIRLTTEISYNFPDNYGWASIPFNGQPGEIYLNPDQRKWPEGELNKNPRMLHLLLHSIGMGHTKTDINIPNIENDHNNYNLKEITIPDTDQVDPYSIMIKDNIDQLLIALSNQDKIALRKLYPYGPSEPEPPGYFILIPPSGTHSEIINGPGIGVTNGSMFYSLDVNRWTLEGPTFHIVRQSPFVIEGYFSTPGEKYLSLVHRETGLTYQYQILIYDPPTYIIPGAEQKALNSWVIKYNTPYSVIGYFPENFNFISWQMYGGLFTQNRETLIYRQNPEFKITSLDQARLVNTFTIDNYSVEIKQYIDLRYDENVNITKTISKYGGSAKLNHITFTADCPVSSDVIIEYDVITHTCTSTGIELNEPTTARQTITIPEGALEAGPITQVIEMATGNHIFTEIKNFQIISPQGNQDDRSKYELIEGTNNGYPLPDYIPYAPSAIDGILTYYRTRDLINENTSAGIDWYYEVYFTLDRIAPIKFKVAIPYLADNNNEGLVWKELIITMEKNRTRTVNGKLYKTHAYFDSKGKFQYDHIQEYGQPYIKDPIPGIPFPYNFEFDTNPTLY